MSVVPMGQRSSLHDMSAIAHQSDNWQGFPPLSETNRCKTVKSKDVVEISKRRINSAVLAVRRAADV